MLASVFFLVSILHSSRSRVIESISCDFNQNDIGDSICNYKPHYGYYPPQLVVWSLVAENINRTSQKFDGPLTGPPKATPGGNFLLHTQLSMIHQSRSMMDTFRLDKGACPKSMSCDFSIDKCGWTQDLESKSPLMVGYGRWEDETRIPSLIPNTTQPFLFVDYSRCLHGGLTGMVSELQPVGGRFCFRMEIMKSEEVDVLVIMYSSRTAEFPYDIEDILLAIDFQGNSSEGWTYV